MKQNKTLITALILSAALHLLVLTSPSSSPSSPFHRKTSISIGFIYPEKSIPEKSIGGWPVSGSASPEILPESYLREIIQKIEANKRYPETAKIKEWEGKARVEFTIFKDGNISAPKLIKSSGYSVFDSEALAVITFCPFWNNSTRI